MKKLLKGYKGFTLIELMIVIAIIAILAAILIPNFIRARGQSQLAACESNLKNMATSLEMYATDNNGNYPSTQAKFYSLISPNYMRQVPTCPSNSSSYGYSSVAALPFTDYIVYQNGAPEPHATFMVQAYVAPGGPPAVCIASSKCVAANSPQYIGSEGLLTGH